MRNALAVTAFLTLFLAPAARAQTAPAPAGYDDALAKKLGADEYGMKSYVLVMLKTGALTDTSTEAAKKAFAGHMANIQKLADEGKLVVAGPLQKNDRGYRGIFIFNVRTVKDADALVGTDPAVAAGYLAYEAFGWYGSAALGEYLPFHAKIEKKKP